MKRNQIIRKIYNKLEGNFITITTQTDNSVSVNQYTVVSYPELAEGCTRCQPRMDVRVGNAIREASAGKNFALKRNETSRCRISHPLEIVNKAPHFLLLALRSVNQRPAIGEQNMNIGTPI